MTDRHSGFLVVLDEPTREDDAEATLNAIRQLRGVKSVTPVIGSITAELVAEQRVRTQLADRLSELALEVRKG